MNHLIEEGSWIHCKDRAVFSLSGPDRVRYLNGQVSNSVDQDLSGRTIAACLCSLKGKVEALVWITDIDDRLIIDGELRQREFLAERLDRYLIADDCELVDETDDWSLVHRFSENSGSRASRRWGLSGEDLWMRSDEAHTMDPPLELESSIVDFLTIRSLLPESSAEISGNEFPSELGLDRWAVDFHKGCYLGQEVVSRIESVGRTKRDLICFSSDRMPERNRIINWEGVGIQVLRSAEDPTTGRVFSSGLRGGKKSFSAEEAAGTEYLIEIESLRDLTRRMG